MWTHLDEAGLKERLEQLDERRWTKEELKEAGDSLGLPQTTPFYAESGWVKKPNDNPVYEKFLSMLRVSSPWAAEREKKRLQEGRDYGWAEFNLVEMAKLCCVSKEAKRPDLSGLDFSGLDLRRAALGGVILSHPDFEQNFPILWSSQYFSERPGGLYANLKGAFLRPENLWGVSEEEWQRRLDVRQRFRDSYEGIGDGRVWWTAPKAEPVSLTMFDNVSRAAYYYCLKDGKSLAVCGFCFPDIPAETAVLAVCALHMSRILMLCTEEEVLFFHTCSGARIHRNGRLSIPVPEGIQVKAARFAPGGTSLELTLAEPVNGSFCASWNLFFREQGGEQLSFYEPDPQMGPILRAECIQEDYAEASDSKKRYLITESHILSPDRQWTVERKGRKGMTPCAFWEKEIVWAGEDRETGFLSRFWTAFTEFADMEDEKDEEYGDSIRKFSWEVPGKHPGRKKAALRLKTSYCQGPQTPDAAKGLWIGFYDGALELDEDRVHRYVFHENGVVSFYQGEKFPGGFWLGCPGTGNLFP